MKRSDTSAPVRAMVELLWSAPKPRSRGPKPSRSVEHLLDAAIGILSGTGLNGADRLDVLAVAVGHLRSIAQQAAASKGGAETLESEMGAAFAVVLRGREADFPEFSRTLAELRDPTNISTKAGTWANNGLSFGLNCIFNGVEARATRNPNRIATRRRKSYL